MFSKRRATRDAALPAGPNRLTPAAERALSEAEERRRARTREAAEPPREVGGRDGPDPVRYGDWEKGGIASDF
jgi:hypothetical protein